VGFLIAPQIAAQMLGMPLLDGLGRSTQVGDFAAFFLTLGGTTLAGSRRGKAAGLLFPALLLGSAAACRIAAWALQGAAFAVLFILVEIAGTVLLLVARGRDQA
jgi:hypothetical protein